MSNKPRKTFWYKTVYDRKYGVKYFYEYKLYATEPYTVDHIHVSGELVKYNKDMKYIYFPTGIKRIERRTKE